VNRTPVYRLLEVLTRTFCLTIFDYRAEGAERLPEEGGVILASTHESHLDPVILQAALPRRIKYVARTTLFRNPVFGWLIRSLGAVAFDRDATTAGGLKTVIDELTGGEVVVYFPEGTRSRDGEMGRIRPGIALLARRSGAAVVPTAIDGTYGCWPRGRKFFRSGRIRVVYGEPVRYDGSAKREEVLDDLERRLRALKARARELP
jgi:1-acyl-sn-glycerol-3-phosphate acyltransferase